MKGKFPSLDPPTRFYFLAGSPCYLLVFFSQASSLFIWVRLILVDIHRTPPPAFYFLAGSPCYLLFFLFTSIIVVYLGSFDLDWYPSRLVPMYFFLGTLHTPTRFYVLIDFPCYLLSFIFFIGIVSLGSSSLS